MRILYVVTRADSVGGASIHVRDIARGMIERGHEALVMTGGEGPVTDQLKAAGVPFHPLLFLRRAVHPIRDVRAVVELAAAVREFGPDLISLHTAKAGWIGRAVASSLKIPAIYTPHGWAVGDRISLLAGRVFGWAERMASRWASAIICVCQYERELALRRRIARQEQLRVVYNGVRDIPSELRARPATNLPRIVSVARLNSPKDHATLLRALAAIRSQPWELHLVGDGPLEGKLRCLAAGLGITECVRFLGYLTDPARTLARAQIFALSSRSEGFPRSVLEAMRAGLPVVASAVGGVPEAVTEGHNGLLVPPGEPAALSAAIGALLSSPELRTRMGLEARRTYESRFRFERMADETEAVYTLASNHRLDINH